MYLFMITVAMTIVPDGMDFPKDKLERLSKSSGGAIAVHGYNVNWHDVVYYRGDAKAFNKFISAYSKQEAKHLKVILHVGTANARSPWDKGDREISIDWKHYDWLSGIPDPKNPTPSSVSLWLGSKFKLDELVIPPNVEVVSGGEIEAFIKKRKGSAAVPLERVPEHESQRATVEFEVESAGWSIAPRPPGTERRGPVRAVSKDGLPNGGRFYLMLWGDAATDNQDARCKALKGKRVRATGEVQRAHGVPNSDFFMTIFDAKAVEILN